MAGFEYGNARLRAMKSRLLSQRELQSLAESGTVKGLIAALTRTTYRKPVETALAHNSGMQCIFEALRMDLTGTLGKIHGFYSDEAGNLVNLVLRSYDVHNLKAILRGLSSHADSGAILQTVLPVGELDYPILAELSSAPDARAAIDLLASGNPIFAQPLVRLRAEQPGVEVARMELALEQWSFERAWAFLESTAQKDGVLASALKLDADLANMLTVLRFAGAPGHLKLLYEWLGTEDISLTLITPGHLSMHTLVNAGTQNSLEGAVAVLDETRYGPGLRSGMAAYAQTGRLSDLEKSLRRYRLEWMATLIPKDPLGIGVVLGYIALKSNEIGNLRWAAQGLGQGLSAKAILAEMEILE